MSQTIRPENTDTTQKYFIDSEKLKNLLAEQILETKYPIDSSSALIGIIGTAQVHLFITIDEDDFIDGSKNICISNVSSSPQNPYHALEIDPFAVAHKFNMPAAVFEAFKKTMCGGERGHKDQRTDYMQAIDCLTRYLRDLEDGLVRHTHVDGAIEFISEVNFCYQKFMGIDVIDSARHDAKEKDKALFSAYLAGFNILRLFSPAFSHLTAKFIINSAIENLNSAIYWLDQIELEQVQS